MRNPNRIVIHPIEIKTHPSIPLFTKPIEQLLESTLELELSDDETEEEKLFYSTLDSILGTQPPAKKRKISNNPYGILKGTLTPVPSRYGQIDLQVSLQ
jgi:hypothetical protein